MNTETESEIVTTGQPGNDPPQDEDTTDTTPESDGADEQEDDGSEDEDGTDSNGDETSEGDRRSKPKRPRWSDVNRANREALEARRELDDLRRQLHEQHQPKTPQSPVQSAEKPTLESCDFDQEQYLEKLAEWKLDQREAAKTQRVEQEKVQATVQERRTQLAAKEADFIKAHPDYEGVAKAPHVPITQQMAEVMLENPDTAPAIAYYLGQNIEEAAQIAQMSPVAAARAIGRIEATVTSQPPKPTPPPKPVKPAPPVVPTLQPGASATKDWKQMSTDEHIRAYREKQANQRR